MKFLLYVTAIVFAVSSAFAHNHEKKKIVQKHDKEHHHVEGEDGDHEHDGDHHKPHDHKAHHADHKDGSHGHDKDHKHVDANMDHEMDESHHNHEGHDHGTTEEVKVKPKKK